MVTGPRESATAPRQGTSLSFTTALREIGSAGKARSQVKGGRSRAGNRWSIQHCAAVRVPSTGGSVGALHFRCNACIRKRRERVRGRLGGSSSHGVG